MSAAEIRNVIKQLEKIATQLEGGMPSAQSLDDIQALAEFKAKLQTFQDLGGSVEQALKDCIPIVKQIFHQMEVVMQYAGQMKKPNPEETKQIQKAIMDNINKIHKIGTPALNYHIKALIEGCNSAFWVTLDAPKPQFDSSIEATEFNVFKVKQQKVQEVNKWYDAFVGSLKILNTFVLSNYKMGLDWNPKGTATFDKLLAALSKEPGHHAPAPPPPHLPPPPPPKPLAPAHVEGGESNTAALFAEINVGEDITKRLKKVDRTKNDQPVPQYAKPQQQQVQHQQQQQQVKVPKRYLKENWFLVNFTNEKLIEFKDDEIDMKQSLFIESCVNCGILIKAKVKSIFLQKCEKIELVFDSTVSGVDIVGSKRVKVTCIQQCPSFMVNNSESVHMTFNQSKVCEIISSKTMDLNITYLQEDGELARDTNIPEQFLTVFDSITGKFVTTPLDMQFG